jgi:hypothetical protein
VKYDTGLSSVASDRPFRGADGDIEPDRATPSDGGSSIAAERGLAADQSTEILGPPMEQNAQCVFVISAGNRVKPEKDLEVIASLGVSNFLDDPFLDFCQAHLLRLHPDGPTFDFLSSSI